MTTEVRAASAADDIAEVLVDAPSIARKVAELGARITADYAGRTPSSSAS